jgi:hypothetical protein
MSKGTINTYVWLRLNNNIALSYTERCLHKIIHPFFLFIFLGVDVVFVLFVTILCIGVEGFDYVSYECVCKKRVFFC